MIVGWYIAIILLQIYGHGVICRNHLTDFLHAWVRVIHIWVTTPCAREGLGQGCLVRGAGPTLTCKVEAKVDPRLTSKVDLDLTFESWLPTLKVNFQSWLSTLKVNLQCWISTLKVNNSSWNPTLQVNFQSWIPTLEVNFQGWDATSGVNFQSWDQR